MWSVPQNMLLAIALAAAIVSLLLFVDIFGNARKPSAWGNRRRFFKKKSGHIAIVRSEIRGNSSVTPEIQRILYAKFQKKRLMNKEEYGLYLQLERLIESNTDGMRLFSQVPLGEILRSDDSDAFFCINSKRCDFVVIDRKGEALIALEYHGSGHFQGNSSVRDEVKRLALKKASIPTIEILIGYRWAEVEREIRKELGASLPQLS